MIHTTSMQKTVQQYTVVSCHPNSSRLLSDCNRDQTTDKSRNNTFCTDVCEAAQKLLALCFVCKLGEIPPTSLRDLWLPDLMQLFLQDAPGLCPSHSYCSLLDSALSAASLMVDKVRVLPADKSSSVAAISIHSQTHTKCCCPLERNNRPSQRQKWETWRWRGHVVCEC